MQTFGPIELCSIAESRLDPTHLLQRNGELARELAECRQREAQLLVQLAAFRSDREVSREARRAALNLMEDAVAARAAEQRENAERRRIETAFRESEACYQSLFESMNEGCCVVERSEPTTDGAADFVIIDANPAFQTRSQGDSLIGQPIRQLGLHASYDWQRICERAIVQDVALKFELTSSDQRSVDEVTVFAIQGQIVQRVAILLNDVTKRKATEQAQREAAEAKEQLARMEAELALVTVRKEAADAVQKSELRFQAFLDQNPVAAYIKDEQGHYLFVNRAMEYRFNRELADWVGKNDFDLFPHSDAQRYRQHELFVLNNKQAAEFHESSLDADGRHDYLAFKFPMRDSAGRSLVAGTVVDITRQKRAEASLAANEQRLRALAAQITNVERIERQRLASILHEDVQQLLIAMQMRVATLAASSSDRSINEQTPVLNELLSAAIHAVRTLSRDLVPPALHQLGLSAGLEWLAERFKERHCLTVTVAAEDDADPKTDALRDVLFQCARELLLNVVKHARTQIAEMNLYRRTRHLILTVQDRGVGLNYDSENEPSDTFGLFQLRERLSPLGGTLEVRRGAEQGVVATVTLQDLDDILLDRG